MQVRSDIFCLVQIFSKWDKDIKLKQKIVMGQKPLGYDKKRNLKQELKRLIKKYKLFPFESQQETDVT